MKIARHRGTPPSRMPRRSILQKADEQIAALLIAALGYATVQTLVIQ